MERPAVRDLPERADHFYRFATCQHLEWLEPLILRHELWVPTAAELNDPTEARPRLAEISSARIGEFLKRSYAQRMGSPLLLDDYITASTDIDMLCARDTPDGLLRSMAEHLYSLTAQTRIYSMSRRWDNLSLWAKYAADHTGYCLEFARVDPFAAAREVIYEDTFRLDVADPDHATCDWLFCKLPEWSNEEEVRLVLARRLGGPRFNIDPKCLARVILGWKSTEEHRAVIRRWASERELPLPVVGAAFDPFSRRLALQDIGAA